MISKTELGRVGYQKKYRVAGRVRVPAGHCHHDEHDDMTGNITKGDYDIDFDNMDSFPSRRCRNGASCRFKMIGTCRFSHDGDES